MISSPVTYTLAQIETFSPPGQNAVTYSVNIPQHTSNTGSGTIFLQLKSTMPVQWFAWGQGKIMQGSNIFVVYATESNITVSPRLGVEHVEPLYNPQARISVLDGSGIEDGVITANIRCDSCITWDGGQEDVRSLSSPWIWAIKYGSLLDSNSTSATIAIHDSSGTASLNLQRATGGGSENPFLGGSGITMSDSGQAVSTIDMQSLNKKRIAHAVLMIAAFVILFPLFALGIPLSPFPHIVRVHACLQLCTLAIVIAGLGIGVSMATSLQLTGFYHPVIGIVVVACLGLIQPVMGLTQHWYFRRYGKKSIAAYLHRWFGRLLITLGIINAGLGFRLTGIGTSLAPVGAVIAYAVIAGVVWVSYASITSYLIYRKHHL
ncbi:hypothetical protein BDV26DRAFT_278902 [Aspergillus bertholletiae]|uniref:Cytochrome b561 domain-containing protein n=1 Tax=Aspergillus bertholletiae TaxID=1226010 RepID=A0A5N7BI04_9EURO|nr:hypothetical protein BDV26DRAFT_278902 [Aspergillus bertholletiae]